jgi:MIP family channel proteins
VEAGRPKAAESGGERVVVRKRVEIEPRSWEAYVAEFLGTFLLVMFVTTILSVANGFHVFDFAVIGLVHAFVLAMLIYTLGATSGAHFNPAVTAALTALRKITPLDALIYVIVQLAGGVAGALVTKLLLEDEGRGANYGAVTPQPFISGKGTIALLVEIIGTFVLMWAIMGTAVNPRGDRSWAGLVIGITLGFAVMALGPLDGAGLNPARWFGSAIVSGTYTAGWAYIVGPLVGAAAAGFLYTVLVLRPQGLPAERPIDEL